MNLYKTSTFLLICFFPIVVLCQKKSDECKGLKEGIFYNYPKLSESRILIERFGKYQKETDQKTGDSTLWEIKWKSDCVYTLNFISSNQKLAEEEAALLKKKKATILYKIEDITDNYYTFTVFMNKISNLPLATDTVWLNEKFNLSNSKQIEIVTKEKDLRKPRFNDTSYALVYVYRIGKFTNSLANYPLYLNGNIIGVMKNKSGYIYKILEEGTYNFGSKLMDHAHSTNVEIKFGERYYIKSMIHWGVHATRNFNLEMKVIPEEIGESEFEKVIWNK